MLLWSFQRDASTTCIPLPRSSVAGSPVHGYSLPSDPILVYALSFPTTRYLVVYLDIPLRDLLNTPHTVQ